MNEFLIIISVFTFLGILTFSIYTYISTRKKYFEDYSESKSAESSASSKNDFKQSKGKVLNSFLYLDEYKMYSISSQLFEGLTESVIKFKGESSSFIEKQEGPISSGRVLADIMASHFDEREEKIFHDYSYTLFERELQNKNKVINIDKDKIINIKEIADYQFINIKAPIYFYDIASIKNILNNFNELGEALSAISNLESLKDIIRREGSIKKYAMKTGLNIDPQLINYLKSILKYGYGNHLEVQSEIKDRKFSAILKQENLKEDKDLLIKKYSRKSEIEFNIFGLITQHSTEYEIPSEKDIDEMSDNKFESEHMKEAIRNMTDRLMDVENTFIGRLPNEIILEPIAIYRQL